MSKHPRHDQETVLPANAGEESLMHDFDDIFPAEGQVQAVGKERDAAEALDELDAFLDDFEPDKTQAGDAGPGAGLQQDGSVMAASEAAIMAAADVARGGTGPAEVAPIAASSGVPGRGAMRVAAGALAAASLISVAALWLWLGEAGRLDALEQRVTQLAGAVQSTRNSPMQDELRQLSARVNQLAVVIEGPISHLSQSNEESFAALSERLDKLEQAVAAPSPAAASAAPAHKTANTAALSSSEISRGSAQVATDGGWVINLIALSDEQDAQDEMSRLRKAGVRVQMQQAKGEGKTWYRLCVPGFASYAGAKAYIDTVEKQTGVRNAWVAKE